MIVRSMALDTGPKASSRGCSTKRSQPGGVMRSAYDSTSPDRARPDAASSGMSPASARSTWGRSATERPSSPRCGSECAATTPRSSTM